MTPKETTMWYTKTMQATLAILTLFFIASAGYSQQTPSRPGTYRIPGDPTTYTLRPDQTHETDLVPVPGTGSANPQVPAPISYFHLEFVVKTIDSGKVTSSRAYNMDGNTDRNYHASYRSDTSEGSSSRTRNRTDIDCSDIRLVGNDSVSLDVSATINMDLNPMNPTAPSDPLSATYNGSFYTLAGFGKPTIIFSADAQAPNRKIQMEVTATPIHLNLPAKP
jgi:hypothetical protein